jgi:hypothetical protein
VQGVVCNQLLCVPLRAAENVVVQLDDGKDRDNRRAATDANRVSIPSCRRTASLTHPILYPAIVSPRATRSAATCRCTAMASTVLSVNPASSKMRPGSCAS